MLSWLCESERLGVRGRKHPAVGAFGTPAMAYPTANVLVTRSVRRGSGWGFGWCAAERADIVAGQSHSARCLVASDRSPPGADVNGLSTEGL
jgi:hypothetical protein